LDFARRSGQRRVPIGGRRLQCKPVDRNNSRCKKVRATRNPTLLSRWSWSAQVPYAEQTWAGNFDQSPPRLCLLPYCLVFLIVLDDGASARKVLEAAQSGRSGASSALAPNRPCFPRKLR